MEISMVLHLFLLLLIRPSKETPIMGFHSIKWLVVLSMLHYMTYPYTYRLAAAEEPSDLFKQSIGDYNGDISNMNASCNNDNLKPFKIGIYSGISRISMQTGRRESDGPWSVTFPVSIMLAIRHYNERNGIFASELASEEIKQCKLNITYDYIDSQNSAAVAIENFMSRAALDADIIIGDTTSDVTAPLALVSSLYGIPVISYSATAATLSDKEVYKLFARTTPSDATVGISIAAFFKKMNFSRVGILYVTDAYGSAYKESLRIPCEARNITTTSAAFKSGNSASMRAALEELERQRYNVIVAVTFEADLSSLVSQGTELGLFEEGKMWIFTDALTMTEVTKNHPIIRNVTTGQFSIYASASSTSKPAFLIEQWATFGNMSDAFNSYLPGGENYVDQAQIKTRYAFDLQINKNLFLNHVPDDFVPFAYDAAVAAILAACRNEQNKKIFSSPRSFGMDDENPLFEQILNLQFYGASGKVQFDRNGDRIGENIRLYNHQQDPNAPISKGVNSVIVGEWDGEEWKLNDDLIIYHPSIRKPPTDTEIPPHNQNFFNRRHKLFTDILFAFVLLYSISLMAWIIYNRNKPFLRLSQPMFLVLYVFGNLLVTFTIPFLSIDSAIRGDITTFCMGQIWFYGVGTILKWSTLIIKSYRIHALFFSFDMKKMIVSPSSLFFGLLLLNGLGIVLLVYWSLVDPMRWEIVVKRRDIYGYPIESYGFCSTNNSIFSFLLYSYLFFLGSLAVYAAYKIRSVPTQFHESRWFLLSALFSVQLFIIAMPLFAAVRGKPYARLYLTTLFFFLDSVVSMSLLVIPRIYDQMYSNITPSKFPINVQLTRRKSRKRGSSPSQENEPQTKTSYGSYNAPSILDNSEDLANMFSSLVSHIHSLDKISEEEVGDELTLNRNTNKVSDSQELDFSNQAHDEYLKEIQHDFNETNKSEDYMKSKYENVDLEKERNYIKRSNDNLEDDESTAVNKTLKLDNTLTEEKERLSYDLENL